MSHSISVKNAFLLVAQLQREIYESSISLTDVHSDSSIEGTSRVNLN